MAKINVKLIMELLNSNMSRNQIAATRHIGKHSVDDVKRIAAEKTITFEDIKDMSEDDAYKIFFPDRNQLEELFEKPDYEYVHKELQRSGTTLNLLWLEYCEQCSASNEVPYQLTQFKKHYRDYFSNKETQAKAEKLDTDSVIIVRGNLS